VKADHPLTERRITAITAALLNGPLSVRSLAPRVYLCHEQVTRYLRLLHAAKQISIASWRREEASNGRYVPLYRVGGGKDKSKPRNLTSAQKQRRSIARARQDGDRYDLIRAKDRARKRKPIRDPLVAAVFGARTVAGARP